LEIGEMVISAFIGLVGLRPASRVFSFHLLDSLLTTTTKMSICPHMTSYSNTNPREELKNVEDPSLFETDSRERSASSTQALNYKQLSQEVLHED